jgi:ankyrin repeat protein
MDSSTNLTAASTDRPWICAHFVDEAAPHTASQLRGIKSKLDKDLVEAAKSGRLDRALRLLAQGADPNARCGRNRGTALHAAAKALQPAMIELLLESGACVDIEACPQRAQGKIPAFETIAPGRSALREASFRILVDAGSSTKGCLFWACHYKQAGIVKLLLDAGVKPDSVQAMPGIHRRNGKKFTPLNAATRKNAAKIVDMLLASGADIEQDDWIKCLKDERDFGLDDAEIVQISNGRPLHTALLRNFGRLASKLIEAGAKVDSTTWEGTTPLMLAARHPSTLAPLKLLLKLGAPLEDRDGEGGSALLNAVKNSNPMTVNLLIAAGARADSRDAAGLSALHHCSQQERWVTIKGRSAWGRDPKRVEVAALLLNLGADLTARCNSGYSPIQLARGKEDDELASWLEAREIESAVAAPVVPRSRSRSL